MGSKFLYPRAPLLLVSPINFASAGDNTIISADATKRILVHRLYLVAKGATDLTFKDRLSSPEALPLGAYGGLTFDLSGEPWFTTAAATALIINSSNAVQVSGRVYYTLDL